MSILFEVIEKLPHPNNIAFGGMVQELNKSDYEFLEDHFKFGSELPSNIIQHINSAFSNAGYSSYSWNNYNIDGKCKVFDPWL